MDRRTFRENCRLRKPAWGCYLLEHMTPQTVRVLARAGFDWLWIENEHAPHSYESIQEVIRTADDVGIVTLVRVSQPEYSLIAKALDMGAGGIIIPRVETPEQVRHIIDCAKYPPIGKRGFGIRPTVYGRNAMPMQERIDDQTNFRYIFIQLESRRGVENLEDILREAKDQIDAVLVGPADFQMDIGKPDTPDAPELSAALEVIPKICARFRVSSGIPVGTIEQARERFAQGYNLISMGSDDGFMATAAEQACEELKTLVR